MKNLGTGSTVGVKTGKVNENAIHRPTYQSPYYHTSWPSATPTLLLLGLHV